MLWDFKHEGHLDQLTSTSNLLVLVLRGIGRWW